MRGGMVTAVLCPGPSLRGFLAQPAEADTYIGVNHAAEAFACHYWAVSDAEALEAYRPVGHPHVFTGRQAWERNTETLKNRNIETTALLHEECRTACPSDREWKKFTLTAALILAEVIGSASIRIYGCDHQGDEYFKPGRHPHAEHYAGRWTAEKAVYSRVLGWLKDRHVRVERCFVD